MLNLIRRYLLTNRLRSTEAFVTLPPTPRQPDRSGTVVNPYLLAPTARKAVYLWTLKPGEWHR